MRRSSRSRSSRGTRNDATGVFGALLIAIALVLHRQRPNYVTLHSLSSSSHAISIRSREQHQSSSQTCLERSAQSRRCIRHEAVREQVPHRFACRRIDSTPIAFGSQLDSPLPESGVRALVAGKGRERKRTDHLYRRHVRQDEPEVVHPEAADRAQ